MYYLFQKLVMSLYFLEGVNLKSNNGEGSVNHIYFNTILKYQFRAFCLGRGLNLVFSEPLAFMKFDCSLRNFEYVCRRKTKL